MLVQKVVTRLQSLLKLAYGQDSDYADYDYLANFVAVVNDDIEAELDGLDLHFDVQVVVLLNVPANTTSLAGYQADGQPLMCLLFPNSTDGSSPIEWRVAGQSDQNWIEVPQVGKVLDTNTAPGNSGTVVSDSQSVASFEWRGGIIYISPSSQAVDIRVRGEFLPTLADNDAAPFVKGLVNVIAYKTGSLVSQLGPENATAASFFEKGHNDALSVFEARIGKSKHGQTIRLGGRRSQYPGVGGGFTIPIVG